MRRARPVGRRASAAGTRPGVRATRSGHGSRSDRPGRSARARPSRLRASGRRAGPAGEPGWLASLVATPAAGRARAQPAPGTRSRSSCRVRAGRTAAATSSLDRARRGFQARARLVSIAVAPRTLPRHHLRAQSQEPPVPELFSTENLVAFLTLTALEVVLGIDNIVFISILSSKLPPDQRAKARQIGLALALIGRIALLLSLSWVMKLTKPLFTIGHEFAGRDLILLIGGLFLI